MNNIIVNDYPNCNEKVYKKVLDNGLCVVVIPKKGFNKYYASLSIEFGGNDTKYIDPYTKKIKNIEAGVAHFLEHKMFEMPDGSDVTFLFSKLGVDSNAFTDYNQTSYLINGFKNYDEAINLLLDFVQTPHFTKENVKKEQGIIIQEYKQYSQEPYTKMNLELMKNMYDYAYTEDIVGNIKSIKSITKDILYNAYNLFYHPSNMILTISGDIDPIHTINLVEENQNKKEYKYQEKIKHFYLKESKKVKEMSVLNIDVPMPIVNVGIRIDNDDFKDQEIQLFCTKIRFYLEMICGVYSNEYQEMLDKGLISGFGYSVRLDNDNGFIKIGSYSNKPFEFIDYIKEKLLSLKDYKISEGEFKMLKKAILGAMFLELNDLDNITYSYTDYYLKKSSMFEMIEKVKTLNINELEEVRKIFKEENMTILIGKDSSK